MVGRFFMGKLNIFMKPIKANKYLSFLNLSPCDIGTEKLKRASSSNFSSFSSKYSSDGSKMESLKMIQRAFELNEDDVRANNNYVFANRTKSAKDLKIGAFFDGQVTSMTSFGAFVNIGMVFKMI